MVQLISGNNDNNSHINEYQLEGCGKRVSDKSASIRFDGITLGSGAGYYTILKKKIL